MAIGSSPPSDGPRSGRAPAAALPEAQADAAASAPAGELGRLVRMEGDVLRAVSHNLRAPLARIAVVADDLRARHGGDPDVRRDAAVIQADVERISRLVDQLVTISRLDGDGLTPHPDAVSLPEVVARVSAAAGDRRVEVVDAATSLVPIADEAALEQVLWILLDNAATYAPAGPIRVRVDPAGPGALGAGNAVDPRATAETPVAVEIAVEDEGPGVPAAERDRIFERSRRGSTAGDHAGTGLGLEVARNLVVAMGGRIRCEAAPGGGARFVFSLPAEEAAPPP